MKCISVEDLTRFSDGLSKLRVVSDNRAQAWDFFQKMFMDDDFTGMEAEGLAKGNPHFRGKLNYLDIGPRSQMLYLVFTRKAEKSGDTWKSVPPDQVTLDTKDLDIELDGQKLKFVNPQTGEYVIIHTDGEELDVSLIDA